MRAPVAIWPMRGRISFIRMGRALRVGAVLPARFAHKRVGMGLQRRQSLRRQPTRFAREHASMVVMSASFPVRPPSRLRARVLATRMFKYAIANGLQLHMIAITPVATRGAGKGGEACGQRTWGEKPWGQRI